MKNISICIATTRHIDEICTLYKQLFSTMAGYRPDIFAEADQDRNYIKKTIETDGNDILVAICDEKVVGLVLLEMMQVPPIDVLVAHRYCYIMDYIVDENYRDKCVGVLLFQHLIKWATESGADYVEGSVLSNNIDAINFYLALGMTEVRKIIRKEIIR